MDGAFSDLGKKGQPGSVVLNVSTYQAVGPRFCLLDRLPSERSPFTSTLYASNLVFKHRARRAILRLRSWPRTPLQMSGSKLTCSTPLRRRTCASSAAQVLAEWAQRTLRAQCCPPHKMRSGRLVRTKPASKGVFVTERELWPSKATQVYSSYLRSKPLKSVGGGCTLQVVKLLPDTQVSRTGALLCSSVPTRLRLLMGARPSSPNTCPTRSPTARHAWCTHCPQSTAILLCQVSFHDADQLSRAWHAVRDTATLSWCHPFRSNLFLY